VISDLNARDIALDPTRSFIVQAPAGSGKTGLLVYRILRLLAAVDKPQQVLAITFTRKATAEMRERLFELMHLASRGESSTDAFEQQGIDLARAVIAQDEKHNWHLLDAPHQLQILTIDAFCAKLTGSMPWLSRLGDRPRTTDHAEAHYLAAIEQLFAELLESDSIVAQSLATVMLALDFNYNKARQLFSSMLAKRDQWLRHLLQGDLASMRDQLEGAWQNIVDAQLELISDVLPKETVDELGSLACYAAGNLAPKDGTTSPFEIFKSYIEGDELTIEHWHAVAHMLLTGNKSDWQQLVALEKVLKALAALLQLRFRATGECDHSEVTQRANLALQELDSPTDLGLRMDAHIQHILVDEFQDTSHGQIELLKKLTSGWVDSNDAKTLFLVGDPMQSIYRFREAEVSLFLQVTDNINTQLFPGLDIEAIHLTENFRSSNSLVTWFNSTFGQCFPSRDNVIAGAIRYSPASCSKNDDESACDYLLAFDRDQEATLVSNAVKQTVSELPSGKDQVAILVRTRSQLDYLLPKLKSEGIAYAGIDIQPLDELPACHCCVALGAA